MRYLKIKIFTLLIICVLAFSFVLISVNNANAELEVKTCLSGSFVNKHPKTGDNCFCEAEGHFVAKQECIDGGTGCTEIKCE